MCITSEDVRVEQEVMVWYILCDKCKAKAEVLLEEREARYLFDINMKEYGFCLGCTAEVNDAFGRLEETEIGGEAL